MGWTYLPRKGRDVKDVIRDEIVGSGRFEILDTAIVERKTAYSAVRHPDGYVFALVTLLDYQPNSVYDIGFKDMDEGMGPVESKCPLRILELLSPVENLGHGIEYARAWRKSCYAHHERRAALTGMKDGDRIIIDGNSERVFVMRKVGQGRRTRVRWEGPYGGHYVIPGWRDRAERV